MAVNFSEGCFANRSLILQERVGHSTHMEPVNAHTSRRICTIKSGVVTGTQHDIRSLQICYTLLQFKLNRAERCRYLLFGWTDE